MMYRLRVYERHLQPPAVLDRLDEHVLHEQLVEDRDEAADVVKNGGWIGHCYALAPVPPSEADETEGEG